MTDRLKVFFDTNIFVSAFLSRNPTSPTRELIHRWTNGEFILLVCDALIQEIAEKFLERGIEPEQLIELLGYIKRMAEEIKITANSIPPAITTDPDDDRILACAVAGRADYLITYDPHFDVLNGAYKGIKITKALPFLWIVRGDQPPTEVHEKSNG